MKISQISKERSIQIILKRFYELETIWLNPENRKRKLLDLKHYLASLEQSQDNNLPFLTRLHKHIDENISLEHLWTLIVPIEREYSKTNIVDEDFLTTSTDDHNHTVSCMPVSVVLDNIRSSFNIGGILRTADCAGLKKVYLCGYSASPDHPKVQKSAMGTHLSIEWEKKKDLLKLIEQLKQDAIQVIALETVPSATPPENARIQFPCAILLGNERFGLGTEVLAQADLILRIPVYGKKNSLNVVSAFAITAYEIRKQWNKSGTHC